MTDDAGASLEPKHDGARGAGREPVAEQVAGPSSGTAGDAALQPTAATDNAGASLETNTTTRAARGTSAASASSTVQAVKISARLTERPSDTRSRLCASQHMRKESLGSAF